MTRPARQRRLRVVLGRQWIAPPDADALAPGSVVTLDATQQDAVEVLVDGHLRGRGWAVMVDGKLAVQVSEVLPAGQQQEEAQTQ